MGMHGEPEYQSKQNWVSRIWKQSEHSYFYTQISHICTLPYFIYRKSLQSVFPGFLLLLKVFLYLSFAYHKQCRLLLLIFFF